MDDRTHAMRRRRRRHRRLLLRRKTSRRRARCRNRGPVGLTAAAKLLKKSRLLTEDCTKPFAVAATAARPQRSRPNGTPTDSRKENVDWLLAGRRTVPAARVGQDARCASRRPWQLQLRSAWRALARVHRQLGAIRWNQGERRLGSPAAVIAAALPESAQCVESTVH